MLMPALLGAHAVLLAASTAVSASRLEAARLLYPAAMQAHGAWDDLKFLIGDWTAENGEFSLRPDLDGRILVRRNRSTAKGARHEDLMVIYPAAANAPLRAIFWDNEDHVIQYKVTADGKSAVFVSEGDGSGPRYRLTYTSTGPAAISIQFEVAPPGKDFQVYLQAPARRR
jgi:hypothetical protein